MKILVTGGAGFVGSPVAEYYAGFNNDVVVFDNIFRGEDLRQRGGLISLYVMMSTVIW